MPFTLWSKDRLIGETELDYVRSMPRHRMGDFAPTEIGDKLMPVITGVRRAVVEMTRSINSKPRSDGDATGITAIEETEEWADVAEATAHFEGLELELRGPDGSVIPTESIDVTDTEYTLAMFGDSAETWETDLDGLDKDPLLLDEEERQFQADVEHDAAIIDEHFAAIGEEGPPVFDPDAGSVFPRYQIQVTLRDDASIP